MRTSIDEAPIRTVRLQHGQFGCTQQDGCQKYRDAFMKRMVGRYVAEREPFARQLMSAIIDLRDFDYVSYLAKVQKVHKGNALRDSRKADRAGYYCKQFVWKNFIPDIVEINQSKEVRSGGKMTAAYRRSVEEMGGAPTKLSPLGEPPCPVHCTYNWGIFAPCPGHRQGEVTTDEKLLGYIRFKRNGNYAVYTSILGHGDYLKYGIMYRLHYAIMEWTAHNLNSSLAGLEFIMYGAINSGGPGLQLWKKRGLFEGAYLVLAWDS